ncbi:seizure protein 6 [Etheostoma spectabile]|uniref:seizure protein 6 n=1 Tax=Etheostoma spectabile TaxID=54343 RepID=UPI0013AF92B6|nr:seizure protein 6-like [Etheostoma spectabile]
MMNAIRDYFPLLLVFGAAVTDTGAKAASASEDVLSLTPGGPAESGARLYPTTQDTGRRPPVVTTAPPVNVPNHHPLYRNPRQRPHGQPNYFEHSGLSSSQPNFPPLLSGTPLDPDEKRASDENAGSANMQTTLVKHASAATSYSITPATVTSVGLIDPEDAATVPSAAAAAAAAAAREGDVERPGQPGLEQNGEETTTTTTTTITTTITITTPVHSPDSCQLNLTGPEGYIEAPPQSSSALHSTIDCSYIITVYMGYGVEVQVMNVNLSEGDKVVFEDVGHMENTMLANESILMRGLVVRSHSNQISIRFRSWRSQGGSVLLRYQGRILELLLMQW